MGCALGFLPPPENPPVLGGAAIRFLTPAPGTVLTISLPEDTESCVIDLAVRGGDAVGELQSSQDRAGYVLAEGVDAADAAHRAERVRDAIRIDTVPAEGA